MSTNTDRTRATAFGLNKESEREQSGAFPISECDSHDAPLESDAVIAELAPELVSLIPEPPAQARRPSRGPTPSERAELVIEDLSLWPENPYLASSLVPPPKRPFPVRRALAIAGGMLAAAAIGAAIQLNALHAPHEGAPHKSQASAGITAPAPVAVASPREMIAPPAPVVVAPVAAAPLVAAPIVAAPAPVALVTKAELAKPSIAPPAPSAPTVAALEQTATRIAPVETAVEPVLAAEAAADLPDYPTREQVTAGFESVRGALAQCAAGQVGTAQIKATISNNGRVSYALVGGSFDGSPAGSCMAKAVREAQFPAFAQPRLKVTYPFAL